MSLVLLVKTELQKLEVSVALGQACELMDLLSTIYIYIYIYIYIVVLGRLQIRRWSEQPSSLQSYAAQARFAGFP